MASAYLVGVRTTAGRHFDVAVVREAQQASWPVRDAVHAVLTYAAVPVAVIVLALIAWWHGRRGRTGDARRAVALVAGAELLTEVIKVLLPRPGGENTLPSGHVTLLGAVAVVSVLAAPDTRRRLCTVLACLTVTLLAVGTWVIGWHRPSDVLAAAGVVAVCRGTVSVLTPPPGRMTGDTARRRHRVPRSSTSI